MKHFYIQFYVSDWLKDPELSMCSPSTRGFWIDLLCRIHDSNKDGKLTANLRQMSQLCRCTEGEALIALSELGTTGTADVYEESGVYTVTCRRLARKAELSKARQQAGSKGAASTQAKREQNPNYNYNSSSLEGSGLQRVREFAKIEGISQSDADWFFWKGEGNGWTNGGKPILDWKATIRSWKRAGYLPSQKVSNNGQRQFQKQKAPIYDKLPSFREPTEEELSNARRIAAEEKAKLKAELNR